MVVIRQIALDGCTRLIISWIDCQIDLMDKHKKKQDATEGETESYLNPACCFLQRWRPGYHAGLRNC